MSMERLTELRAQVEKARAEMREAAQGVAKEGAAEVFEKYGDIVHSFGWRQYTPYFNDGDPCEFNMGGLFVIAHSDLEASDEDEIEDDDWLYDGSPAFSKYSDESKVSDRYGTPDERYKEAQQACEVIYGAFAIDESIAKDVFDDHVTVIFSPEGVHVEEYDHE